MFDRLYRNANHSLLSVMLNDLLTVLVMVVKKTVPVCGSSVACLTYELTVRFAATRRNPLFLPVTLSTSHSVVSA